MSNTPEPNPNFRAGMVAVLGRTNAGKSTLVNALVGRKVSIVTPKPQTTREAVQGVVHRPEGQIVFVDTPGFFKTHASALVDKLHQRARRALDGIDAILHVVDPTKEIGEEEEMVVAVLANVPQAKILCLSKSDLDIRPASEVWRARATGYKAIIEVSALNGHGLEELVAALMKSMPVGQALYPEDEVTNTSREFAAGELIREQIYLRMGDEIPYRTRVEIGSIEERKTKLGEPLIAILATILVASDRYKAMVIGAGGQRIRQLNSDSRKELEHHFGKKVFLDCDVMVDKTILD